VLVFDPVFLVHLPCLDHCHLPLDHCPPLEVAHCLDLLLHCLELCWGLVLNCYELRTRQHKMLRVKDPSSFETLSPLGHNDLQTKVMKDIPS
jgi:hypothetical protein